MKAAEEPPNLKNLNQRRRKLGRIAQDFARLRFQILGSLFIGCEENQIDFARIIIDFVVVITHTGIALKYLHTTLGRFETQSMLVVRNTRTGIDLKYLLNNSRPRNH